MKNIIINIIAFIATFAGIGIVIALLLISIFSCCTPKINEPKEEIVCIDSSFCVEAFVLELHIQEIRYTDIVLRQACLESGFFKSDVFLNNNNPFGFFYKGEYLVFDDYRDAVSYYKTWQDKWYKGGNYYDFLNNIGYAEDSSYIFKVKSINLNNLK